MPEKVSHDRVRDWFREKGIYSCWASRKPLLSSVNITKRLAFAKQMENYDWSKVVFSDEKMWRVRPCGERVKVWRKSRDRFHADYTVKTVSRSVGIMVWAAINSSGQVVWKRCPEKVNAEAYQDLLASAIHFIRPRYMPALNQIYLHFSSTGPQPNGWCSSTTMPPRIQLPQRRNGSPIRG